MCGISGKIYYDRTRPVERERIAQMCDAITHRGPDAEGFYIQGPVGLGSRRLSIIDVAGGQMPISNEDGSVWIVYNGEVYNYKQLRQELIQAGHQFTTTSDTEVIVHLYEEKGEEFPRYLNGMFACAIWDERKHKLLLARDQMGIKPLYYAALTDRLVFGSEIKELLLDGVDRTIDLVALHDYLSLNYVPGPRSIFTSIQKLSPGHILVYDGAKQTVTVKQYWDLPQGETKQIQGKDLGRLEDELLALLRTTVRDQMVSDVPIGAFLSGGIDSSLIVALMSEFASQPVKTFSIGFQEGSYSELPYARMIARRFHTDHHELVIEPRAHDSIKAMANYFDEPFADSSAVAVYAVSQLTAQHVKVALSGDGGDELFGGYYTYQADKIAALYRQLPHLLGSRLLPSLVDLLPVSDKKASWDFKLRRFMAGGMLAPLPAHFAWKAYFDEEAKLQIYRSLNGHAAQLRPSVHLLQQYYDNYQSNDMINRLLYVDMKVQLADDMLTKVDRMSMAHSIEVRVPLLDLRLAEFMAQLPSHLKVRRLTLKYLLKRVAQRVLPHEILHRRKAGFSIPVASWVKTDLREMVNDYLGEQNINRQGLFDPKEVRRIVDAHWSGKRNHSHNIWNLLMFSLWYERYMKVPVAHPTHVGDLNKAL